MTRNIISTSLSLMVVASLLAACGPTLNQGTTPNTSTPGTGQSNSSNASNNASGSATVVASSQNSAEMQAAMQTVIADEMAFRDTQTLTAESSFSTQALEVEQEGEVSATLFTGGRLPLAREARQAREERDEAVNKPRPVRTAVALRNALVRSAVKAETRTRLKTKAEERKTMVLEKKAMLEASGALTVNADGTLTIDPAKLKAEVKANTEDRKAKAKAKLEQVKAKIQTLREVAKEKKDKLVSKAQAVRTSDTEEIENEDGSITKITKIEFKNEKTGVTRNVTSTRTTMDEKLVSAFYTLEATHQNYTRTVERSVEVNAEGQRTVKVTAVTTWQDGRKRERSEERVVAADGSATGGGTLTVTRADGTVKTYTYTLGVTRSGDMIVNSGDADTEVTLEGTAESTEVTVVVEESGESTELAVDLDTTDTEAVVPEEEAAEESPAEEAGVEVEAEAEVSAS